MKKLFLIIISVSMIFLLNTCALEIANVIGPDGGYVFYDKGNYNFGWRYIQCSPYDFGELKVKEGGVIDIEEALRLCNENSAEWHKYGWEIPTEAHLKKMLECFSYGLTRFSPDYYYLSVNNLYDVGHSWVCIDPKEPKEHKAIGGVVNTGDYCIECGVEAPPKSGWITEKDAPPDPKNLTNSWEVVVLHKNFDDAMNGLVEKAETLSDVIRLRAIRRF